MKLREGESETEEDKAPAVHVDGNRRRKNYMHPIVTLLLPNRRRSLKNKS